jgi:hypothetical protein
MRDFGTIALMSTIISAAAPNSQHLLSSPEYGPAKSFVTAKSTDQFASCFAGTQDDGALPWRYVPKDDGGTFSNLGPRTIGSAYFVVVSDRGPHREVRLEGNGASEVAVKRAVSQCV